MKMKILGLAQLPKWALFSIGVGLLVAVFAVGALAAPYIPSPFKAKSPTDPAQQVVSEQVQAQEEGDQTQQAEEPRGITSRIASAIKRTVGPITTSQSASQSVGTETETKAETGPTKTTLQIENVKIFVEDNTAVVTWTTSLLAESRLIFDNGEGRVFESETGLATSHKIHTTGLEESQEYDFKIAATNEDKSQSDDYYDTIYAPKKYTAIFGSKEDDCQIIIVKDTAGRIAAGKEIRLSPSRQTENGITISRGGVDLETNSRGEIEYCGSNTNRYRLTGTELDITLLSY